MKLPLDALYGDQAEVIGKESADQLPPLAKRECGRQARRLTHAIAKIRDPRLLSLFVNLIEGMASCRIVHGDDAARI